MIENKSQSLVLWLSAALGSTDLSPHAPDMPRGTRSGLLLQAPHPRGILIMVGGGVCKANQRGWRTTQDSIREQKSGQGVAGSRVGQERSQRSLNISTPSTLEVEGTQGSGATRQWGLREAVFRFHHPPNWKRFQRPSTWGRMNKALQPHHEKLLRDRKEQATDERQQHG